MNIIYVIGLILGGLIIAGLQRRFSPETLINGFMDRDKAEELAPTLFKKEEETSHKS
jgi:hypothetical protein